MKKILSELLSGIVLLFLALIGLKSFSGKGQKDVQKKIDKRKNEIGKLDTAGMVNLANSILSSRRDRRK